MTFVYKPEKVIKFLHNLTTTSSLNSWDFTSNLTTYIYLRTGLKLAVWSGENNNNPFLYWMLGRPGNTELGVTTILAPDNNSQGSKYVEIVVFDTLSQLPQTFKDEFLQFIPKIIRAAVKYSVTYTTEDLTAPPYSFSPIGYTYKGDPRVFLTQVFKYDDTYAYPFNMLGFV